MPPLLLIVDDDMRLVDLLTLVLARYKIATAANGADALLQVDTEHPDLVLLDLKLPDFDGCALVSMIRQRSKVPLIVLSGQQGHAERVLALNAGADDFIGKPFDLYDLEARIEAVLRRSPPAPVVVPVVETSWHAGSFVISEAQGASLDGVPFHLTPHEFLMMRHLIDHAGEYVPRAALIEACYGSDAYQCQTALVIHLSRVRARLKRLPGAPSITTLRGRGYRLEADALTA